MTEGEHPVGLAEMRFDTDHRCAFCDHAAPYLAEDVAVPVFQLIDKSGVYTVCGECFETAEHGADPDNVKRSFRVSTIVSV